MAEDAAGPDTSLTRLTAVSRALTYAVSLDEVLEITVDCAVDLLGAERVVLMLRDDDDLLRVRACRGIDSDVAEHFAEHMDETLIARLTGLLGPYAPERFLGVPLVVGGRVTGLLAVLSPGQGPPGERDEWLLSALADQASVALENARREDLHSARGHGGEGADAGETGERGEAGGSAEAVESVARPARGGEGGEGGPADGRDDALRMVSHELKSPLNALNGYLHLLVSGSYGEMNEAQRTTVERLQTITAHLGSLVANILEMGHLAMGSLALESVSVELEPIVDGAVAVLGMLPDEEGVQVVTRVPAGLEVRANPDRLRQVLVQLLDNAVKHAPRETEVTVTAEAEDDGVAIRIRDRGAGVPAEHAEAIFEPYTRLDGETAGGMGLGLAIGRGLVERMGGTLVLDGEAAEGATFVVRLERG